MRNSSFYDIDVGNERNFQRVEGTAKAGISSLAQAIVKASSEDPKVVDQISPASDVEIQKSKVKVDIAKSQRMAAAAELEVAKSAFVKAEAALKKADADVDTALIALGKAVLKVVDAPINGRNLPSVVRQKADAKGRPRNCTPAQEWEIIQLLESGLTQTKVARAMREKYEGLKISQAMISRILASRKK